MISRPSPDPRDVLVADEAALIEVRRQVTEVAQALGFGVVEHTKLITASSELGRNILQHAGTGRVTIEPVHQGERNGVRLTFADQGPGIPDVDLAMQEGYTSAKGMGLGLPGAKRLTHEFSITTEPGRGTRVVIVMWKR